MKRSKGLIFTLAAALLILSGSMVFANGQQEQSSGEGLSGTEVRVYATFRGQKFPTFNESTPWEAPNGLTYNKGDTLPSFTFIEDSLGIKIIDATPKSGQRGRELIDTAAATGFKDAELYQGTPRQISDYGVSGYFHPLNHYWEQLPNFRAFLDVNPSIEAQLTQSDGNIYLAPYFDDINQLERMFVMRLDWVKKLLDEPSPAFNTNRTIDPQYEAFNDYGSGKKVNVGAGNAQTFKIAENIIDIQNGLGTLNGQTLARALRDYIDDNYMNGKSGYANRSDLFISGNAAYDADELVALMRVVKTNAEYLTGEDKDLIVFFPRDVKNDFRVRQLGAIWGVRGLDSRSDHWLVAADNTLQDARLTDDFYEAFGNITKLYKEGLILADFDQPRGNIDDFRSYCFNTNDGFITYDYAASTVAKHDLLPAEDKAAFGTVFEPVVPAAAQWFGNYFEHFSESNRSIKSDGGWGIVSNAESLTLQAALKLLDFPFSKEGLEVMTFGPKGLYWNEYTTVAGLQVPKLIPSFYDDLLELTSGNWSNFMRGFVGATLPIGHVKQTIAIEKQISNEHYGNGIERIASSGMTLASLSSSVDPERRISPAMVPLSEDYIAALSLNTYGAYHDEWETRLMKFGFGGSLPSGEGKVPTVEEYQAELINKGLAQTVKIYNKAYEQIKE